MRFDLHCHSLRSDGALSPEEVVEAAVAARLDVVGIVEHLCSLGLAEGRALRPERLPEHVEELRSLRARRREQITVLAGVEIRFSLLATDFTFLARSEPERSPVNQLDFVLFEHVNDGEEAGLGLEELLKLRPLFQVPVGLAHSDLERCFGGIVQPETLAQILAGSRLFVELGPGSRHRRSEGGPGEAWYRRDSEFVRRFFAAALRHGVELSVGSDAHDGAEQIGDVQDALDFLSARGLAGLAVAARHWGRGGA